MRFLVIRNDVLGDAVISSTFIEALFNSVNCQIDVLCNQYNSIAFAYHPLVSQIFTIAHEQGTKRLAIDYQDVISKINSLNSYDAVFVLNPCLRSLRYASLIKARFIFGRSFKTKSFKTRLWFLIRNFYSRYLFLPPSSIIQHEVETLYSLLNLGLSKLGMEKLAKLPIQSKFYLPPEQILSQGIRNNCVINVSGKTSPLKYLNDSMILSLLIYFNQNKVFSEIAVICVESDLERVKKCIRTVNSILPVRVISSNNLLDIANNIAEYEFFISGDGGLVHIAAGLGLKCITLFDQQSAKEWHPWTPTQIALQASSQNIYDISYIEVINAINELA